MDHGLDALVEVGREPPDLLIADLRIPGIDGFEMIRRLRDNPLSSDIATVVVSAPSCRSPRQAACPRTSPCIASPSPSRTARLRPGADLDAPPRSPHRLKTVPAAVRSMETVRAIRKMSLRAKLIARSSSRSRSCLWCCSPFAWNAARDLGQLVTQRAVTMSEVMRDTRCALGRPRSTTPSTPSTALLARGDRNPHHQHRTQHRPVPPRS